MGVNTELSAVVVTYNSAAVIEACCRSVRRWLPEAEILVVDNGSSDDTVALCQRLGGIDVLAAGVNAGFGRACNQGVGAASGTHVLIFNPDVELSSVDAARLEAELALRPFGLKAPVLEGGSGGGSLKSRWTRDLLHHALDPVRPRELPALARRPARRTQWWPAGALLMVERTEFLDLGGFDPRFFLYYEDRDLARRYGAASLPIGEVAALRAQHSRGTSSTGEAASAAIREGWSYLSWIEYLAKWEGPRAAARAVSATGHLRRAVDGALALLERAGPLAARATRKREQMRRVEAFVAAEARAKPGDGFYPEARAIIATYGTTGLGSAELRRERA